jgi:hypothetical protein
MADVTLTHPRSPRTVTVRADMASTYRSQGWIDAPADHSESVPDLDSESSSSDESSSSSSS